MASTFSMMIMSFIMSVAVAKPITTLFSEGEPSSVSLYNQAPAFLSESSPFFAYAPSVQSFAYGHAPAYLSAPLSAPAYVPLPETSYYAPSAPAYVHQTSSPVVQQYPALPISSQFAPVSTAVPEPAYYVPASVAEYTNYAPAPAIVSSPNAGYVPPQVPGFASYVPAAPSVPFNYAPLPSSAPKENIPSSSLSSSPNYSTPSEQHSIKPSETVSSGSPSLPSTFAVQGQYLPIHGDFIPAPPALKLPCDNIHPAKITPLPIATPVSGISKTESIQTADLSKTETRDENGQYSLNYKTGTGINVSERGYLKPGADGDYFLAKEGSYSYTSPEGVPVSYGYKADESGYTVGGSPLPVPPEP